MGTCCLYKYRHISSFMLTTLSFHRQIGTSNLLMWYLNSSKAQGQPALATEAMTVHDRTVSSICRLLLVCIHVSNHHPRLYSRRLTWCSRQITRDTSLYFPSSCAFLTRSSQSAHSILRTVCLVKLAFRIGQSLQSPWCWPQHTIEVACHRPP